MVQREKLQLAQPRTLFWVDLNYLTGFSSTPMRTACSCFLGQTRNEGSPIAGSEQRDISRVAPPEHRQVQLMMFVGKAGFRRRKQIRVARAVLEMAKASEPGAPQ